VVALVDAARSKNLPIARIEVTRDGLSLVVGEPTKAASEQPNGTPWDEVLANEQH
jgi:hypothetical protein